MYLQIVKNKRRKYFVRLKGNNGKIILWSEDYSTKSNAMRAIKRIMNFFGYELLTRKE